MGYGPPRHPSSSLPPGSSVILKYVSSQFFTRPKRPRGESVGAGEVPSRVLHRPRPGLTTKAYLSFVAPWAREPRSVVGTVLFQTVRTGSRLDWGDLRCPVSAAKPRNQQSNFIHARIWTGQSTDKSVIPWSEEPAVVRSALAWEIRAKGLESYRDSKVRLTEKRGRDGGYVIAEKAAIFEGRYIGVMFDGWVKFNMGGAEFQTDTPRWTLLFLSRKQRKGYSGLPTGMSQVSRWA